MYNCSLFIVTTNHKGEGQVSYKYNKHVRQLKSLHIYVYSQRKQNTTIEQGLDKRKIAQYENTEITLLSEEQLMQMCDVMDVVD